MNASFKQVAFFTLWWDSSNSPWWAFKPGQTPLVILYNSSLHYIKEKKNEKSLNHIQNNN